MAQQFMLVLFEKPGDFAAMSPEQIQKIIEQYTAWTAKVGAAGKLTGGHKLREEGGKRMVQTAGKLAVTDGPYAETKEVVGGIFLLKAESYDEGRPARVRLPALEVWSNRCASSRPDGWHALTVAVRGLAFSFLEIPNEHSHTSVYDRSFGIRADRIRRRQQACRCEGGNAARL